LFDLYHEIVFSPVLPITRSWTLARLRYFNRLAFLNRLLDQHPYLPEEFRLWILEWPANFAFGGVWPGLPVKERAESVSPRSPLKGRIGTLANNGERLEGWNWLGYRAYQVSAVYYHDPDATRTFEGRENDGCVPALLVWSTSKCNNCVWLVLDKRDKLRERVYDVRDAQLMTGDVRDKVYSGWVEWLRHVWKGLETAANSNKRRGGDRNLGFSDGIPADPWQAVRSGLKCKFVLYSRAVSHY
jgi:hypothetical protein